MLVDEMNKLRRVLMKVKVVREGKEGWFETEADREGGVNQLWMTYKRQES